MTISTLLGIYMYAFVIRTFYLFAAFEAEDKTVWPTYGHRVLNRNLNESASKTYSGH